MQLPFILKRPIVTERSVKKSATGQYTFAVAKNATKPQIKQAIETYFAVTVTKVRTAKISGKTKRVGRLRRVKQLPAIKKAIIELKAGDKIDSFEGN